MDIKDTPFTVGALFDALSDDTKPAALVFPPIPGSPPGHEIRLPKEVVPPDVPLLLPAMAPTPPAPIIADQEVTELRSTYASI